MLQWLCSINSNLWCFHLNWTKDWNTKYSNSAKITHKQVLTSAAVLDEFLGEERQLYVNYLDARWGSFCVLEVLAVRSLFIGLTESYLGRASILSAPSSH